MAEYEAEVFFKDGRSQRCRLFAIDGQEAIRRVEALFPEASDIELSRPRHAAPLVAADDPEQGGVTGPGSMAARRPGGNRAGERARHRALLSALLGVLFCALGLSLAGWVLSEPDPRVRHAGPATVVNGRILLMAGEPIWLAGIEADPVGTPAGNDAYRTLSALIEDGEVVCVEKERDEERRLFADCSVGGRDLAQALIDAGAATPVN